MKYRLLKEAALQELKEMEENALGQKKYLFRHFYSPSTMREKRALEDGEPYNSLGYLIDSCGEDEDDARWRVQLKLRDRFGEYPIAIYSEEEWKAME